MSTDPIVGSPEEPTVPHDRYRQIVESTQDGIWIVDEDLRTTFVNAAMAAMLQTTSEDLMASPLFDWMDDQQWAIAEAGLKRRWEGIDERLEIILTTASGTPVYALVSATRLIHGEDHRSPEALAVITDVSELRATERTLRTSEERFRSLVLHSSDLVLVADANGTISYASPSVEDMLGYPAEHVVGKPLTDLIQSRFPVWLDEHLEGRSRGDPEATDHAEAPIRHADGSTRAFHLRFTDLLDDSAVGGIVISGADVTERTQFEIELQRHVAQKTDELRDLNRSLLAAKEAAEKANRSKNAFLSRVSHELRTPLNAILGFGQLLESSPLPDADSLRVSHILTAGRRLLDLVNEVMDIVKLESSGLSLSMEPVSIVEVVAETLERTSAEAAERGIAVNCEMIGANDFVLADRHRLSQALGNVLANAVKFNHDGGTVDISSIRDRGSTAIRVADTGRGIPADQMDRLFSAFDRLDAERIGDEGAGLGLTLAKAIVEAMGGTLHAQSTPGIGTAMTIALTSAGDPTAERSPIPDELLPGSLQVSGTILYIEDNLANIELVTAILAHRRNVTVVTAREGRLGIDLARERRPDLVLLDLHLPDMTGEEALGTLRLDPATKQIPVVVMSADANDETISRLLAAGASEYMTKPIDVGRFLHMVDDALEGGTTSP